MIGDFERAVEDLHSILRHGPLRPGGEKARSQVSGA